MAAACIIEPVSSAVGQCTQRTGDCADDGALRCDLRRTHGVLVIRILIRKR